VHKIGLAKEDNTASNKGGYGNARASGFNFINLSAAQLNSLGIQRPRRRGRDRSPQLQHSFLNVSAWTHHIYSPRHRTV